MIPTSTLPATVWGDGSPMREFLYVGTGTDVTIREGIEKTWAWYWENGPVR